ALLLSLSRKIPEAQEQLRRTFSFSQHGLRGFDLAGKTIGVVGCGHIGMPVIKIAKGFGMQVLGFDTRQDAARAEQMGFTYVSLEQLLASSDIVTIHVPYMPQTHHLINMENIQKFKPGAYLVNTARGAIVETQAVIAGLKSGVLAGAALDVLEEEGELGEEEELLAAPHKNENALRMALENHVLIRHPRVVVTPHIAFNTEEAVRRIIDTTIENMLGFAAGTPKNLVQQPA
ncbi:MAG TPA: NAD(P)-dependent oxidoreductase, partial [Candidatus Paceibacterota bacterium]|nr:NAD(P)-dependent oxidoreductase [Candidatus Paceibacterota bacterium]